MRAIDRREVTFSVWKATWIYLTPRDIEVHRASVLVYLFCIALDCEQTATARECLD